MQWEESLKVEYIKVLQDVFPLCLLCVHNAGEMRGNILENVDVFFKSAILK